MTKKCAALQHVSPLWPGANGGGARENSESLAGENMAAASAMKASMRIAMAACRIISMKASGLSRKPAIRGWRRNIGEND